MSGPVSRWVGLDDPLLSAMIAELTADYVAWYGPGAHHEMARHPAEVFTPPGGGVLALVQDGVAVAAGAFRPRGAPGLGEDDGDSGRHPAEPGRDPAAPGGDPAQPGRDPADRGVAEVKRMWTASQYRRRGLARRVLRELEDAAAAAGYTTMYLSTGWRQAGAVALYLATGYRPLFDLDGDPAVPFERAFVKELVGAVPRTGGDRDRRAQPRLG